MICFFLALDVVLYGANFHGMNLAGIIIIAVGFFLVMFPNNWPEYISRLLRYALKVNYEAYVTRIMHLISKLTFFQSNFGSPSDSFTRCNIYFEHKIRLTIL